VRQLRTRRYDQIEDRMGSLGTSTKQNDRGGWRTMMYVAAQSQVAASATFTDMSRFSIWITCQSTRQYI